MNQNPIVTRFNEEAKEISAYLHSLHGHACFNCRELERFNEALTEVGLHPLKLPSKASKGQRFSLDETHALIDQLREAIEGASSEMATVADTAPDEPNFPPTGLAARYALPFDAAIDAMMKRLPPNAGADDIRRTFSDQLLTAVSRNKPVPKSVMPLLFDLAIDFVQHRQHESRSCALVFIISEGHDLLIRSRSARPGTEIHIFRQGFLLLMTAFDAAVFDLMRGAMQFDFFGLVGQFETNDKMSYTDLARKGSFENLQNGVIDTILKKQSLSDLLAVFVKTGAIDQDTHLELNELVLRRHLHVHTRGVVDQRYVTATKNSKKLRIGEVAMISEDYSQWAERLTKEAVTSIGKNVEKRRPRGSKSGSCNAAGTGKPPDCGAENTAAGGQAARGQRHGRAVRPDAG
jgi:hypothetical protein